MKVMLAASQPSSPAHSTKPQSAIDERKPMTPSAISALRPRLSDWRAQCGAVSTQSSADQLKARLTQTSGMRSEEHTSELQSLMRISYAVFCLKKKTSTRKENKDIHQTYKEI